MSDVQLVSNQLATPFALMLAEREGASPALCTYRGILTPPTLDVPESEVAAVTGSSAVHDMGWLSRAAVRGEDRFRWLSGMVTNTVHDLAANSGAWNLVLNAQGRIQGDLYVWREGDSLELEIAADQFERLIAHLEHFIIMDDVELVPLSGETALGLTGPDADQVLRRAGLPVPAEPLTGLRGEWKGFDLVVRRGYGLIAPQYTIWAPIAGLATLWSALQAAGATPVGSVTLEALRIAQGIPAYGIDIAERDLPQETSQLRALHFNKGCYLGQEIVERIRSRGNVHRHLRQLELAAHVPASGTELLLDGAKVGHITSAAELPLLSGKRIFALGMIREEAELQNRELSYVTANGPGYARILASPPRLS